MKEPRFDELFVGEELPAIQVPPISRTTLALYAGASGDHNPIHIDLDFARRFVDWNTLDHGVQRVDACRTPEGDLLLVELEDLNPYLSLDRVPAPVRERFAATLTRSLQGFLAAGRP